MRKRERPSESEIRVLVYLARKCAPSPEGTCEVSAREVAEGTGLGEHEVRETLHLLCPPGGERVCVTPRLEFEPAPGDPGLPVGVVRLWPEAREVLKEESERQEADRSGGT